MSRSIRSYLPDPDREKVMLTLMQARVPVSMKKNIKAIAQLNNWTESQVIRAGMEKFIDDELPYEQRKLA